MDQIALEYWYYGFLGRLRVDGRGFLHQTPILKNCSPEQKSSCRTCAEACHSPLNCTEHPTEIRGLRSRTSNAIIIIIFVVVVVDDDTYYWVYLSPDHPFQVYSKCDSLFYYEGRWSVITKCDSFFYYKVRQVLLQRARVITKCDRTGVLKIRLEHNKEYAGYHRQIN